MFTGDKVTEIFCMADDFCKFFDAMMAKYTIKDTLQSQMNHAYSNSLSSRGITLRLQRWVMSFEGTQS